MSFAHLMYLFNLSNRGSAYLSDTLWVPVVVLELQDRELIEIRGKRIALTEKGQAEVDEAVQLFQQRHK